MNDDTTEPKPVSDTILIKDFFEMSSKEAIQELKNFPPEQRKQLAAGIRDGSFNY